MKKYIQVQSNEHVVALRAGALAEIRAWSPHERGAPNQEPPQITIVEPQGLVTRDEAIVFVTTTLTLNVSATRSDALHAVRVLVQLASREFAAALTRDELIDGKDAMIQFLRADVGPRARALGIELVRVGIQESLWPESRSDVLTIDPECPGGVAGSSLLASRARRRCRSHSC